MHAVTAALVAALLGAPPLAGEVPPGTSRSMLPPRPDLAFAPDTLPDPMRVRAVLDYTARAQMQALVAQPLTLRPDAIRQAAVGWVPAAFYTGATRLLRVSPDADLDLFLREVASHYNYGLGGSTVPVALINADAQAIGELYEELYARSGQAGMLMPLRQRLVYTLPWLALDPAPRQLVWWWCDALYMAPPVYARMSVLTGDPRYLTAMDAQWWRTYDRLWDPAEQLYFRDERFTTRRSASGAKIFWSRGMGWVVGGYARVLEAMPADFPTRPRYIATLRRMLTRLARLQRREDGLWTASLLDPQAPPGPEASGSAFIIYAMAWGINHGVLDRAAFLPHVLRGWAGLSAAVQPDGLLGYVQRTGDQPVPAAAGDHGLYGTGALLLAGLEVMRLGRPATRLPIAEPPRDPPVAEPPPAPLPVGASAAEAAEYARRIEERRAVRALAFDPAVRQE